MRKNELIEERKQRAMTINPWKVREHYEKIEDQQTSDDFIANGGSVIDGGKITRDRLAVARKCGITTGDSWYE
jgi:hypothetical protein